MASMANLAECGYKPVSVKGQPFPTLSLRIASPTQDSLVIQSPSHAPVPLAL